MTKIKYASPHILESDIKAVADVMRSGTLTQGKEVKLYEREIAKYVGSKYAVAFNSATTALYCAYKAVGLGEGDEFTTTPISFVATANVAKLIGAKVFFQDRKVITGNFAVPVHYAGRPHLFYGDRVVEDASHALGSEVEGRKVGSCLHSDVCVFSTHAIKNITTGEGGIATTNIPEYYDELMRIREHGRIDGQCRSFGFNFRLTEMQAALGRSQLRRIDSMRDQRQAIFDEYTKKLSGYVETPEERSEPTFWHLYPVLLKTQTQRDKLRAFLKRKGIETQIHYKPIYLEPAYQDDGWEKGICPKAEDFWHRELSLPIHCNLFKDDVHKVIYNVRRFIDKCPK